MNQEVKKLILMMILIGSDDKGGNNVNFEVVNDED